MKFRIVLLLISIILVSIRLSAGISDDNNFNID
jgi:hypothetical protein